MIEEKLIREQLGNTLNEIDLPNLGRRYQGKVRENYINDTTGVRTIISTDRLSAFDRVITTIPFKGQLLNQMSAFWFKKTKSHFIFIFYRLICVLDSGFKGNIFS